eukprot:jgi/Picsp_1/1077/NSC_04560-R1_trafficking protein particle complex subunit 8-like
MHEDCLGNWEEELMSLEGKLSHTISSAVERGRALGHVVIIGDGDGHSKKMIEEVERKRSIRTSFLAFKNEGDGFELGTIHGTTPIHQTPQSFIESLAAKSLIPHIEDMIRKLELVIGASRRGLKNQLKSFLFRRTPSQASDISAQPSGKSSEEHRDDQIRELNSRSVEAAMREQSDLCIMIGDYETAISTLKLLSSDLKSDRLHFHYASCQECLGAAHVLSSYSNAEALGYFREAFYKYSHLADIKEGWKKSLSVMYSTRAALTIARLLSSLGKFKEASLIVMKAHFQEDNLRAAFLLEYAAVLLKSNDPPKFRKHGFYLVLAALRYGQARKYKLAAHSHQYVVSLYGRSGWDTIEEHVREALGKNCEESGRYQDAFEHYLSILGCSNLPSQLQDLHLSQIRKLYDTHSPNLNSNDILTNLAVPVFNSCHFIVECAGKIDYGSLESREIPEKIWKEMEFSIVKAASSTWLDNRNAVVKEMTTSCVDEDIIITIDVYNPLKIEIRLSDLRLICSIDSSTDSSTMEDTSRNVIVPEQQITLYPGERAATRLICRPLVQGVLSITGLSWKLNGILCGQKVFTQVASKWSTFTELDIYHGGQIQIQILPPMPRLQIRMDLFPRVMHVGEIVKCPIEVSNTGAMSLNNVQIVASPNIFFESAKLLNLDNNPGSGIYPFRKFSHENLQIDSDDSTVMFCYVRPTFPGQMLIHVIWKYEPVSGTVPLLYRILRVTERIEVLPSLEIKTQLKPAFESEILLLNAKSLQEINSFKLAEFRIHERLSGVPAPYRIKVLASLYKLEESLLPESSISLHFTQNDERYLQAKDGNMLPPESFFASQYANSRPDDEGDMASVKWELLGESEEASNMRTGVIFTRILRDQISDGIEAKFCVPCAPKGVLNLKHLLVKTRLQICSNLNEPVDVSWVLQPATSQSSAQHQKWNSQGLSLPRWEGNISGTIRGFKPGERREVKLWAVVSRGVTEVAGGHISWFSRIQSGSMGTAEIKSAFIEVSGA